ncbi:MAG: DUF1194 domain-containing protein [Rhizobiales bacterium]|nr:DUF1194 domain-containing protein [Hyphomicrobiales bacterium]
MAAKKVPVAVQLVLALDASASVDAREFRLQIDGLAAAFADPEVLREVENLKPLGAAIAVVQWGGPGETRVVLPFTPIQNAREAKAFGFRASLIRRWLYGSSTSIADGIAGSQALIETADFQAGRQIIDVSGDGADNGGGNLAAARARARAAGITINGLPIMADDAGLADYYLNHVIAGDSAFAEPARNFADFARAIKEKLLRELRPLES